MTQILLKYWQARLAEFESIGNTVEADIARGAIKSFGG